MPQIPNTEAQRKAISHLITKEKYIGDISSKGFIIKRNFGVRRLPIYGIFKKETIQISVKNEFLHQVFLIFGSLLLIILIGLSLYAQQWLPSILLLILLLILWIDDTHRKNKEYKILIASLNQK